MEKSEKHEVPSLPMGFPIFLHQHTHQKEEAEFAA
jgi:hypothetical protein